MDGAFLDTLPETVDARKILLDQLAALAKETWVSEPRPLTRLELGAKYCPPHAPHPPYAAQPRDNPEHEYALCPPLCSHFAWPERRPRYDIVSKDVTEMTVMHAQVRKTDEALNSQLYRGVMRSSDGTSVPVGVKIYHTSRAAEVNRLNVAAFAHLWAGALHPFRFEHWAYDRMEALQGIVVPHVYGSFKVRLQGGEPAIAMIMEFVSAASLPELQPDRLPIEDPEVFNKLTFGLAAVAHAVANCGVLNMDYPTWNVIWHGGRVEVSPDSEAAPTNDLGRTRICPFPVLIDFALCKPVEETADMHSMLLNVLRAIAAYGVREGAILPWWEQNSRAGAFLGRIFDAPAGDLAYVAIGAGYSGWEGVVK